MWGALPARSGIFLVIAGAALGAVVTVLSGSEPGFVLGVFLIAGTLAGALAVRPGAVYRIIPAPALAYLPAAVVAGLIHDRAADTSLTGLAVSATQWIAGGFLELIAATIVAIAITVARWQRSSRDPGQPGRSRRAPAGPPATDHARPPADRRPGWVDAHRHDHPSGFGPSA